jgi:MFS transporter, PAT family, beta-lactamase induction signal transducer AmpG
MIRPALRMTETAPEKPGLRAMVRALAEPHVRVMLLLGFSSGLPFLLSFGTLSAWLATAQVSYKTIGLMSLANFAYSFKFLWAPAVDNVPIPVLSRLLGRRRAWMLVAQAGIVVSLLAMAQGNPAEGVGFIAAAAVCLAFASATQDIAIDAWRIEAAPVEQQPLMAAITTLGYRLGMLTSGAGALYLSTRPDWNMAYVVMAACVSVGVLGALLAKRTEEPEGPVAGDETVAGLAKAAGLGGQGAKAAAWLYRAVGAPFVDFFARHGVVTALLILLLIGLYSISDRVMGVMANPFYIAQGFTTDEIATVSKLYGIWIGIAGALIGGIAAVRIGPRWTLIAGIFLGAASNLSFAWLATRGHDLTAFWIAITMENALGGFSGIAIIAYLSSLTNVKFSGTQYALFSSFAAMPGKFVGAGSGYMVEALGGFYPFFLFTAALGVAPLLLALYLIGAEVKRERRAALAAAQ